MPKLDLKREIAAYSARRGAFEVVEVPPVRCLMIDGRGDPNSSAEYRDALEALFPVAYKLKFLSKRDLRRDYVVMPLEGLWWADDMTSFTTARDKSRWSWTLLNVVPDWIEAEHVEHVRGLVDASPAVEKLRFEEFAEGRCVQTLHVGPYDEEGPVLAELHERFIPAQGLRMTGRHHEIYLSDARRTAPEKLKTILRQPVADA
ncbi:GyrI-like domain-containing protein [Microbacterium sp. NPDC019599]|uniref:GyrI-like domain-containing protein n=1 Tax=Microbacterium sp. NPDC019599 TaxID=3154690 RepID=UPI0033FFC0E3